MNKLFLGITLSLICLNISIGQNLLEGQKRWSSEDKLTVDDYKIKVSDENNDAAYSQFIIYNTISGFDLMKNNLNQKIENIFLGNASWIDTTKVTSAQKLLEFQQIQFDIAEIQAREFRKRVLIEKRKILKDISIIIQISNEVMAEFSKKRLQLMRETESGRNEIKIVEWKEKIANELLELYEFRYENKKKIKLKK